MARTATIPGGLAAMIEPERKEQALASWEALTAILNEALARRGVPAVSGDPQQLESELLEGARSSARTPTKQEWQAKKRALDKSHRKAG